MNLPSPFYVLPMLLGCGLFFGFGCRGKEAPQPDSQEKRFPTRMDLAEDENGIARLKGDTAPFTGSVVHRNKDWRVTYYTHYQDGKKCGPEVRFYESGRIYRVNDYHDGKQIHQREWHETGGRKLDAAMVDGIAQGRHLRWHESGNLFWEGELIDGTRWHGRIRDLNDDGSILWDAEFDRGKYLSGVYPAFMQPKLLESGALKPEHAVFTEEEIAASLAEWEASEARKKAEKENAGK